MKSIIALLLLASSAFATIVSECDDDIPFPSEINVENCEEEPCYFVRGSTVIMNMTFEAPQDLTALKPIVVAKSLGIEVRYPLNEPDGCKSLLDAQCPVKKGQKVVYHLEMPVLKIFPLVPLNLRFTMEDQTNQAFQCFSLDAQVVDA